MGRKRTRAKITLAGPQVHDRRASDLLRNAMVDAVEVDDPYATDPGGKILAFRSLRDDPLLVLLTRDLIDTAQFDGGRHYQHDFETAERGPCAIDPTKEAVDGGKMPDPITESQRRAVMRLGAANRKLGLIKSSLVMDFLIHRQSFRQIAANRGLYGAAWEMHFSAELKDGLNTLAIEYGCAHPRSRPRNVEDGACEQNEDAL